MHIDVCKNFRNSLSMQLATLATTITITACNLNNKTSVGHIIAPIIYSETMLDSETSTNYLLIKSFVKYARDSMPWKSIVLNISLCTYLLAVIMFVFMRKYTQ